MDYLRPSPEMQILFPSCFFIFSLYLFSQARKEKHLIFGIRDGAFSVVQSSVKQSWHSQISLPSRRAGSPDHIIGQFANFCSSLEVWFENVAVKMKTLEVKRAKFGMEKDLVE